MRAYLSISGVLFGLVALGHLARAALGIELLVDGTNFPFALSWGGGLVAAVLSAWGLRLAATRSPIDP